MPINPQVIETSADVLTANLFTMSIIGLELTSPNFHRVDGMGHVVETVIHPDGGSGLQRKFHGGTINFNDITIARIQDGTDNDKQLYKFIIGNLASGNKSDGVFIKYHKQSIVRRIEFLGMCMFSHEYPSYDNAAAAGDERSYPTPVDYCEEVFV